LLGDNNSEGEGSVVSDTTDTTSSTVDTVFNKFKDKSNEEIDKYFYEKKKLDRTRDEDHEANSPCSDIDLFLDRSETIDDVHENRSKALEDRKELVKEFIDIYRSEKKDNENNADKSPVESPDSKNSNQENTSRKREEEHSDSELDKSGTKRDELDSTASDTGNPIAEADSPTADTANPTAEGGYSTASDVGNHPTAEADSTAFDTGNPTAGLAASDTGNPTAGLAASDTGNPTTEADTARLPGEGGDSLGGKANSSSDNKRKREDLEEDLKDSNAKDSEDLKDSNAKDSSDANSNSNIQPSKKFPQDSSDITGDTEPFDFFGDDC